MPLSFSASAVVIPVEDDETVIFTFSDEEGNVKNINDPNNLTRGDDGIGCVGWGLRLRTDMGNNGIGYLHAYDGGWADSGGYRLNNNDGVYNLETSTTYVVSFKLRVKSGPVKEGSLNKDVASVLSFGYGFTGNATGNACSTMHVTVAEVVKAQSVAKEDKANATFTLNNMNISKEVPVSSDWHEVTYAFTTPATFGDYVPSLGFYSSCYHGTDFMVDDVEVTRLGADKGVVVLYDEFGGTNEIVIGDVDSNVELPELTGEYEFSGWFKDANRTESAEGLTFANGVQTLYTGWKAPVTVTFIDTLNGGEPYVATGVAGEEIVYPETPVDNVNEPDQNWFIGWYTTASYTEEFTATTFGYSNCDVYAKWQGEYETLIEDFENYGSDRFSVDTDENGYLYPSNRYYFGYAMDKITEDGNSYVKFTWKSDTVRLPDVADSYNAAKRYNQSDHMIKMDNAQLLDGVTYTATFDYYVESVSSTQSVKITPMNAHPFSIWGSGTSYKDTSNIVFGAEKMDGKWHKGQFSFTMKYADT